MSKADWGLYDTADNTYVAPSKKVESVKSKPEVDWDAYDQPQQELKKKQEDTLFEGLKEQAKTFLKKQEEYGKTALKGTAEGITQLGRMVSPLQDLNVEQKQTEALDKLLPTENEEFGQKALRRGLKQAPSAIATGGGSAYIQGAKALGAGILGESAKELDLPEWAQTAAELTAYIGPDVTKKLLASGKDKKLIEFAKKMGMTDEEITPLIQSANKQKWLSKLAHKKGKTEEVLSNTKKALGDIGDFIKESPQAAKEVSEKANGKLINGIYNKLNEMPSELRGKVEKDLSQLLENKITGRSLMKFWKDLNSHFKHDRAQLSVLKGPIKDAMKSISPELSQDFEMLNNLYSKYYPIASKLKPGIADNIVAAAEIIGGLASVVRAAMGDFSGILAFATEQGARHLAKEMLINPRFQQIGSKLVIAFNQNKFNLARKLLSEFKKEVSKIDPKSASKIEELTEEEFKELLKAQH